MNSRNCRTQMPAELKQNLSLTKKEGQQITKGGSSKGGSSKGGSSKGGSTKGGSTKGGSIKGGPTKGGSSKGGSTKGILGKTESKIRTANTFLEFLICTAIAFASCLKLL